MLKHVVVNMKAIVVFQIASSPEYYLVHDYIV